MTFKLIDPSKWNRKEYFEHYRNAIPCTYSITLNLNITHLYSVIKKRDIKLYPATIYLLSLIVNKYDEFRMALDESGNVGVFDLLHPSYTVLQKKSGTFTNIWTEFSSDFSKFYQDFLSDVQNYSEMDGFFAKPNAPLNTFPISSLPWISFNGFNLNIPKGVDYLLPIFTMGKFFEQNGQKWLPLAIQAHHSVCDGYHIGLFVNDLQEAMDTFPLTKP